MPKDKCPLCNGLKDIRAKKCKNCAGHGTQKSKRICPTCKNKKDHRADLCKKCQFLLHHPRLNTGKDWHVHKQSGYITKCINGKDTLQHRHVMEKYLGRKLESGEIVHHIDKNRGNNKIENLELMLIKEHHKLHFPTKRAKEMNKLGHKARWGKD